MKSIILLLGFLGFLTSCTKSETQYRDQNDKKATVNDKASDTIQTLPETSDTLQLGSDRTDVKTDNE